MEFMVWIGLIGVSSQESLQRRINLQVDEAVGVGKGPGNEQVSALEELDSVTDAVPRCAGAIRIRSKEGLLQVGKPVRVSVNSALPSAPGGVDGAYLGSR